MSDSPAERSRPVRLGLLIVFSYLALEWLFLVTKPSFADLMGPTRQIGLLAISSFLVGLPTVVLLWLISRASVRIASALVTLVLGCLFFLLVDNFLYTILGLGTLGSPPEFRLVYTAIFLSLLWFAHRELARLDPPGARWVRLLASGLLLLALPTLAGKIGTAGDHRIAVETTERNVSHRPNLLFVGLDGVEAELLSVYGQELETTPFLQSVRSEFLVFENAFPDTGKTTGSVTALFTGRSPLDTRVGFPPQVLLGSHSFRHLPAVLDELGYEGFQYAVRYYADAVDLNFREAFSEVNGRRPPLEWLEGSLWLRWLNDEIFFLQKLAERLRKRLSYLLLLDDMRNHFLIVQENRGLGFDFDRRGLRSLERFAATREGPFYAHLHFMSTHCCTHSPRSRYFSAADLADLAPQQSDRVARRLNAIRDVDGLLAELYEFLQRTGTLEDTILVVYSDHSYAWDDVHRMPLLIRFPHGALTGSVPRNVLLSMVPGFLLDHLGISPPPWMRTELVSRRPLSSPGAGTDPLFGVPSFDYRRHEIGEGGGLSRMEEPGPPNFGFRQISMILCSSWYKVSLSDAKIQHGIVLGHTSPCPTTAADHLEAATLLASEIERRGFVRAP